MTSSITQPIHGGIDLFMIAATSGVWIWYVPASPSRTSIRP